MKVLKIDEMVSIRPKRQMVNESFKSKVISNLFKNGELETDDKKALSLFNQVKDDEIVGIANNEEEAKKLLHDKVGDKYVTKYEKKREYYYDNPDGSAEVDFVDDYNRPYKYNETVEGYKNWIFKLNSGRFLVLRIQRDELRSRLWDTRDGRDGYEKKYEHITQTRKKFLDRKKYVEKHKDNIKNYFEMKNYLEEKGLWDEFVKTTKNKLSSWANNFADSSNFESDMCHNEGTIFTNDEIDYEIGGLHFYLYFEGSFDGELYCWGDSGDYWTPGDFGCELQSCEYNLMYIEIKVIDIETKETIFLFKYLPEFDKKNDMWIVDM